MYREPLDAGQEFSFQEPLMVVEYRGGNGRCFRPADPATYADHPGRKRVILPEERFIVQDGVYISIFHTWSVSTWHGDMQARLSFEQMISLEAVNEFFPIYARDQCDQIDVVAVTDVRWPEPSPESLMVQVRVLSYWRGGSAKRQRNRHYNPIRWRECERLQELPLEQGLTLALEWLQGYVPDPAAALRQRGFAV